MNRHKENLISDLDRRFTDRPAPRYVVARGYVGNWEFLTERGDWTRSSLNVKTFTRAEAQATCTRLGPDIVFFIAR
jgi:hypothetical protein